MLYYLLAGVLSIFSLQFFLIYKEEKDVKQSFKDMWGMMIVDGDEDDEFIVLYWLSTIGAIVLWPFALCYYAQLHLRNTKK